MMIINYWTLYPEIELETIQLTSTAKVYYSARINAWQNQKFN